MHVNAQHVSLRHAVQVRHCDLKTGDADPDLLKAIDATKCFEQCLLNYDTDI